MSSDKGGDDNYRKPDVFDVNDAKILAHDQNTEKDLALQETDFPYTRANDQNYRFGWLSILISAFFALCFLFICDWLLAYWGQLITRNDWLSWISISLLAIIVLSFVMIILSEIYGLVSLKAMSEIKSETQAVLKNNNLEQSRKVIRKIKALFRARHNLRWGMAEVEKHEKNITDVDVLLIHVERELLAPIDKLAKEQILISARRVSVITAISPFAVVDILAVSYENLRLLKRISYLYGGRPRMFSLLRLGQMVVSHLALTGGVALSSDLIQQFLGHKIAAKLSAKFGEGLFNGAMTTRVGIAAINVCRPIPFIKEEKPSFSQLAKILLGNMVNIK